MLALQDIRSAAEKLKSYEAALVERLQAAIYTHRSTVDAATNLPEDGKDQCERIVLQCDVVIDRIARAREYQAQIMARADLLDHTGILAKMIRDLTVSLAPPPGR